MDSAFSNFHWGLIWWMTPKSAKFHLILRYIVLKCNNGVFLQIILDGRPVYIVKIGSMDFKGLLKTVGETGFIKQV